MIDYKEKTNKRGLEEDSRLTKLITALAFMFCVCVFYTFVYMLGGDV